MKGTCKPSAETYEYWTWDGTNEKDAPGWMKDVYVGRALDCPQLNFTLLTSNGPHCIVSCPTVVLWKIPGLYDCLSPVRS